MRLLQDSAIRVGAQTKTLHAGRQCNSLTNTTAGMLPSSEHGTACGTSLADHCLGRTPAGGQRVSEYAAKCASAGTAGSKPSKAGMMGLSQHVGSCEGSPERRAPVHARPCLDLVAAGEAVDSPEAVAWAAHCMRTRP